MVPKAAEAAQRDAQRPERTWARLLPPPRQSATGSGGWARLLRPPRQSATGSGGWAGLLQPPRQSATGSGGRHNSSRIGRLQGLVSGKAVLLGFRVPAFPTRPPRGPHVASAPHVCGGRALWSLLPPGHPFNRRSSKHSHGVGRDPGDRDPSLSAQAGGRPRALGGDPALGYGSSTCGPMASPASHLPAQRFWLLVQPRQ